VRAEELADLCLRATAAGPTAFADEFIADDGDRWAIGQGGKAAADLRGQPSDVHSPLVHIPVKLGTLAAAQLEAIGTLLTFQPARRLWRLRRRPAPRRIGMASLGRAVVEACGAIAWILDDSATAEVRHRRAWLLWAVAEGNAARTATIDAGRTGAMSGSPERLAEIEAQIHNRLGVNLERATEGRAMHPKDWRLDGVTVPGQREMVVLAVERWFPGADGGTLYSQVSRPAHSDVDVALAFVDNTLRIPEGEGVDFVATVLAFWGRTWTHVISYLGLASKPFVAWRTEMLVAIGRRDLVDH
jgi:hypothetical protein